MPRRNRVPESVSMETPKAKRVEEQRRRQIQERQQAEERPSVSANTPAVRQEKARVSEEARLSTGVRVPFTDVRVGAVPRERWDRMTWEQRAEVLRMSQNAMETAVSMAAVPGMIMTAPAGKAKMADRMLGGRKWIDLSREEKLKIKSATGLEQVTGGRPGWVIETPVDPQLKKGVMDRFLNWHAVHGRPDAMPWKYEGGRGASLDQMFTKDSGGFIDSLGDRAQNVVLRAVDSRKVGLEGAAGAYVPTEGELRLTERATQMKGSPSDSLRSTAIHELQHVEQHIDPSNFKLPYGSRPHEIEAHAVAERWNMTPEQRAKSLIEDSHPGLESWGTDFYDEVLRDQEKLRLRLHKQQDAKGGDTRKDAKVGEATETFDTPIPKELQARYDAWYAQLPENLRYTGDYDLQGAWLEKLGQPDRYEATQNGHLDDYGKKPNHITFSTGSKWHDPKVPERTGGEWRQAKDGSWDFYPGPGNKASDDELKAYFDKYEKGNRVHKREVHEDAKGGDAPGGSREPVPRGGPAPQGGPRIVINPSTFRNKKDALCVAFNERFRIAMEQYGFEPQSEPTDRQRRFFADTAYADDEVQLRRTILARILTLDTSVKDPTDEQLREAVAFLQEFKRRERPSNDWEASAIDRLEVLVQTVVNKGKRAIPKPQGGTVQADIGGGTTEDDDEENRQQAQEPEEPEETEDTQEPIEEAAPPTETAEPEQPTESATEQPSTEPQVATTEPPPPENLEPGQTVTNNGVVMPNEEVQRQADEFKRSLLGDTDNSQDAAITEEPRKPEEASQPPQTQTAQRQAPAQTQQPAQQQTRTQAQAKPAAPSTTVPQPVQTEGQQPAPGARWTTKNQRRMRRYLRALYGKEAAYDAVYGASAKTATIQSPAAKPVRATPRRRT